MTDIESVKAAILAHGVSGADIVDVVRELAERDIDRLIRIIIEASREPK